MIYPAANVLVGVSAAYDWSLRAHNTGACWGMPLAAGALDASRALLIMAPLALAGALLAAGGVEATVGTLVGFWAVAPVAAAGLGYALVRASGRWSTTLPGRPGARAVVAGLVGVGIVASFAMGANDVANATGPVLMTGLLPIFWAGLLGGVGIAVGVVSWGGRILRAVAFDVVRLDPAMAFGAQLAQATVILVSVGFGYFTSMNQALVGSMIGAGIARGERTVRWATVRGILLGWLLGPLSAVALSGGAVYALATAGLGG